MQHSAVRITVLLCLILSGQAQVQQLASYRADPRGVSMGGFSSGGFFTAQYHTTFSSELVGVAIMAGGIYYCAHGTLIGVASCITPALLVDEHIAIAKSNAEKKLIDPTSNIEGSRVYILSGKLDTIVLPVTGLQLKYYYDHFGANVATAFHLFAEHGFPTSSYGNLCGILFPNFLNRCYYSAAFESLNHIYGGGLKKPSGSITLKGDLIAFDQDEFVNGNAADSCFDNTAYAYIPFGCKTNSGCRVHVFNHGCGMGRQKIGDELIVRSGYNEVGELNNIIIIYPQISTCVPSSMFEPKAFNPFGCHDLYGYLGEHYAWNNSTQMTAIRRIIQRVTSRE
ncbi:hypothetical protein CHUAL_011751 [Chamberlinius hualienensis]